MRVLLLSWEYPPVVVGGLGRHVHALAESLAAAGHDVTVVSRASSGAPLQEVVGGVSIVRVPEDPPLFALSTTTLLAWTMAFNHALTRAALRVAEQFQPEVVHAHDWLVAHAAITIKHHCEIPLVATLHATEAGRHQGWLPEDMNKAIHSVEWWLTYEARRVITCSQHMSWEVRRLFELPAAKVHTIANGVQLERWQSTPESVGRLRAGHEGPRIFFAGRLVFEKGAQDLLRAADRLRGAHPGLRLLISGEGPYLGQLQQLATELAVADIVHWLGFIDDGESLAAHAAACDVAVVPSIYEPFGMVALEAAAAGTPLVVADTGGLREFIDHEVSGLKFTPGDVDGLVAAISRLLDDEVLARRMERGARQRLVGDYSWAAIATETAELYGEAADAEAQLLRTQQLNGSAPAPLQLSVPEGNLLFGDGA